MVQRRKRLGSKKELESNKVPAYSVSPAGEKFNIPQKSHYGAEFKRLEKLATAARAEGKEVVAIAGTSPFGFEDGGGADTALVMIPWKSGQFNKLPEKAKRRDVKEIVCKPR